MNGSKRFKGQLRRYTLVGVTLFVVVPLLALNLFVRLGWGEKIVRSQLRGAVLLATDSAYRVDLESISFSWGLQDIRIDKIILTRADSVGTVTRTISVEALHLRDIHWIATLLGRPGVDEVEVRTPRVSLTLDFIKSGADEPAAAVEDSSRSRGGVEVGTIRLLGGTITVASRTGPDRLETSLHDVNLEMEGIEREWPWMPGYVLSNSDVSLKVGSAHVSFEDSLYAIDIENASAGSRDSSLSFEAIRVAPLVSDSAFGRRQAYRRDRIDIGIGRAALHGVDFDAALRDGSLRARLVVFDSLGIDVFSDHRIPARTADRPHRFLTEEIRDAPFLIAVDSVAVLRGRIVYSERARDGERPGTIRFDDFSGSITNLSNDPDHTRTHGDLRARVQGSLMGATIVSAELSASILSPTLDLSYRANAGPAAVNIVNDMLIPLEGIEFLQGHVDTLWLDAFAINGVSDGVIHMPYSDLAIRTVDKNSGRQSLGRAIESTVARLLLIHKDNPERPDGEARVGNVSYTRRDQDTLWGFLWFGIRGGLLSLIVRGGELPGGS